MDGAKDFVVDDMKNMKSLTPITHLNSGKMRRVRPEVQERPLFARFRLTCMYICLNSFLAFFVHVCHYSFQTTSRRFL